MSILLVIPLAGFLNRSRRNFVFLPAPPPPSFFRMQSKVKSIEEEFNVNVKTMHFIVPKIREYSVLSIVRTLKTMLNEEYHA